MNVVIHSILCLQFLLAEIERALKLPAIHGDELSARLSRSISSLGLGDLSKRPEWAAFIEIDLQSQWASNSNRTPEGPAITGAG